MIDIIYLQKDYDGKCCLSVKTTNKCEEFPYDYYVLETVPNTMTIQEVNELIVNKYRCNKLIIQF